MDKAVLEKVETIESQTALLLNLTRDQLLQAPASTRDSRLSKPLRGKQRPAGSDSQRDSHQSQSHSHLGQSAPRSPPVPSPTSHWQHKCNARGEGLVEGEGEGEGDGFGGGISRRAFEQRNQIMPVRY